MHDAITVEEFDEKYKEYMLNGLSSHNTYIPLKTNKRVGINIALRPYVARLNSQVVMFGGKLRVGYTLGDDLYPVSKKVVDLHEDDAFQRLAEFCKGFSWQRQDFRRFSTVVGLGVAASPYDPKVLDTIVSDGLASELLNKLEATYSQYNDGATFNHKRKAAAALNDAWLLQAAPLFQEPPVVQQMPANVLGKASGKLLNQAQEKYTDNVVSFTEKVAALKEKQHEV